MKAELKADGALYVCAETELESYALSKWWADRFRTLGIAYPDAEFRECTARMFVEVPVAPGVPQCSHA